MKVKNLYDIQSFDRAVKIAQTFDGEAGILLPRQLEHISTTIYEQKFAELSFLNQGISVNNEGGVAEIITKLKGSISISFGIAMISREKESQAGKQTDGSGFRSASGF